MAGETKAQRNQAPFAGYTASKWQSGSKHSNVASGLLLLMTALCCPHVVPPIVGTLQMRVIITITAITSSHTEGNYVLSFYSFN